jgi:hypothetical protein
VERSLRRLGVTPLAGGRVAASEPGAAEGVGSTPPPPPPPSPLDVPLAAAAPPGLAITPLAVPGLARLAAAGGLAGRHPLPPRLDVTPPVQAGPPAAAPQLAISPLPAGLRLPAAAAGNPASPKQPQPQPQRSVLGERTNGSDAALGSPGSGQGTGMLPPLPPPLPTAAAEEAEVWRGQQASPSFAGNAPLPAVQRARASPRPRQPSAEDSAAGSGVGDGGKPKAGGPQVAALSPAGSGVGAWRISAVPGEQAAADERAAAVPPPPSPAALLPSAARGKELAAAPSSTELSFVAAERSFQQLSGGPGAAWTRGDDARAVAAAGAVPPSGLRDDILALHLDMLTQFQVGRGRGPAGPAGHAEVTGCMGACSMRAAAWQAGRAGCAHCRYHLICPIAIPHLLFLLAFTRRHAPTPPALPLAPSRRSRRPPAR